MDDTAHGILAYGSLESAVERMTHGPFPDQGDLFERAALLLRGIAQDHPFVDGNKRTAFEATDALLSENGHPLIADPHAITGFMVDVATGAHSIASIQEWLLRHANSKEEPVK